MLILQRKMLLDDVAHFIVTSSMVLGEKQNFNHSDERIECVFYLK
jgi:hypothetical protein